MSVHYEIVVWSGADNILTGETDGEVDFFNTKESKEAFECYKEKILEGYTLAYITVKKHYTKDEEWFQEEYGNDMGDCAPMSCLPKYIKKNLGSLVDFVCPDFETYEEAKAFFS
tara:strand:+ start:304 stop:645 length:342 start_codon:yes stop_codon:yes gene_type:complete